ncbi:MAG: hypothetical protein EZS28_018216 [Streblomastix strix]|uniref:B30.2/SPRY domain-containing protein n=1 Tax=Streblomastix strix TaxID=222440 RepID=A0A5J4VUI0_9EUKA|nr:MAG: hypothetical protein EZS28_018216 [Streblomastix strix]
MDHISEYNVNGSLLGLGENILLEIMTEMIIPQQIQKFLVVCKKIYKLKEHSRFGSIIQSIIQIAPTFIIEKENQGTLQGMKFIHSDQSNYWCTIAIDPIIKEGIVRFEIIFENTGVLGRNIGTADASCSFASGKRPWEDGNDEKTVRYYQDGVLNHIAYDTIYNGSYKDGQRISAIVDMTSNPRKVVFYVDDIEQPNYVIGIPSEIRFWVRIYINQIFFIHGDII